ncbi:MAG: hypothetical protein IJD17_02370 [Clostridia bacterium]|nr:hypothetical protein [Clostridia bacterium]
MKKYLGNYMTKYVMFGLLLFIVGPHLFTVVALTAEFSFATVFIALINTSASILSIVYFIQVSDQLISVAYFTEDKIVIKNPLKKKKLYEMKYKQCADIGIGSYLHIVKKYTLFIFHIIGLLRKNENTSITVIPLRRL